MTTPPPERRSRAALQALLVRTGMDVLWEDGLGVGAGNLTLQRVFDRLRADQDIRVTHGSVLGRIWPTQHEFQRDVLVLLATDDGADVLADTAAALGPTLAGIDLSTPEARTAAVAQLVRVGCAASLTANADSRRWRVWTAVWALAMTGGHPDDAIHDALRGSFQEASAAYGELYGGLAELVGYRLRAPYTLDQFVTLAVSLAEGCAVRDLVDRTWTRDLERPTGPDGAMERWTLLGIALEALVEEFFEPVPDAERRALAPAGVPGP